MEVKLKNIRVRLGDKDIIKNLSLEARPGEIVGIIGPNGSGKSTLLKAIYRQVDSKGAIYLAGEKLEDISIREAAKKIAVVSQHNDQIFDFNVGDMVILGRTPYKGLLEANNKEDYKIVRESLKYVGMLDYIDRSYSSLSGGERQRVILARALAQKSSCLILDEPTNHLDIKQQFLFMNTVKKMGITIIAAIHDLNIAGIYCDRLYAIKDGELIKSGEVSQVLTEDFILELYGVRARIIREEGQINVMYRPF